MRASIFHTAADEAIHVQEREHNDASDKEDANPAERRQEKKERIDKPGPDSIDQDQEDAAHEKTPIDTPR